MMRLLAALALILSTLLAGTAPASASGPPVSSGAISAGINRYLTDVTAIATNNAWTVGYSFSAGSTTDQTLTEHWNGSAWSVVPSPNVGTDNNVLNGTAAVFTNQVWAVGSAGTATLAEHWNGSAWSVVPSPNVGTASFLYGTAAPFTNNAWAVGQSGT